MDSEVSTSSEWCLVSWGGEGRIQQVTLIKPSCPPPLPRDQRRRGCGFNVRTVTQEVSTHITEQLLAFSFLKVVEIKSDLLGRWRSLLERRRVGLGLGRGCSLLMQAIAAVRNTLWMLFSEVNAEHSRYASAPSCLAIAEPCNKWSNNRYCSWYSSMMQFNVFPVISCGDKSFGRGVTGKACV